MKKCICGYKFYKGNKKQIIKSIFYKINQKKNETITCLDTNFFINYYANPRVSKFYNDYNYIINSSPIITVMSLFKCSYVKYISQEKIMLNILNEIQNRNLKVLIYIDKENINLCKKFFKEKYPKIKSMKVVSNKHHEEKIISFIKKEKPDILLIANTNNSQSEFALKNANKFESKLIISCGSFFSKRTNKITYTQNIELLSKIIKYKINKWIKKNTRIKGYVVGWFYPPQTTAQAISTFKILKNSKYKYDVFTTRSRLYNYSSESSLDIFDTPNIKVFPSNEENPNLWCDLAAKKFIENSKKYSFFMTRVMPSWSHDVGLKIREYGNKTKWIASFADPMFNSPYTLYNIAINNFDEDKANSILENSEDIFQNPNKEEYKCFQNLIDEKNKILKVFKECDLMIFTNKYQMKWMLGSLYKNYYKKCYILPHSYDPDFYLLHEKANSSVTKFLFIGHTDTLRNLNNFVKAINEIIIKDHKFKNKLKVTLIGDIYSKTIDLIKQYKLENIFDIKDNVDYLSSIDIMSKSDVLIHSDAKFEFMNGLNVYFASKISDYLGTNKIIFSLSTKTGPTVDVLKETNHIVCEIDKIDEIKKYIIQIVNGKFKNRKHYNDKYSSQRIVKEFDYRLIKTLKGKK